MSIYRSTSQRANLTTREEKAFNQLQESLGRLAGWLEINNYRGTAEEAVIVPSTSRFRGTARKIQRIYRLPLPVLDGRVAFKTLYAIDINGNLLVNPVLIEKYPRRFGRSARWVSAQITGINPDHVHWIVQEIDTTVRQS